MVNLLNHMNKFQKICQLARLLCRHSSCSWWDQETFPWFSFNWFFLSGTLGLSRSDMSIWSLLHLNSIQHTISLVSLHLLCTIIPHLKQISNIRPSPFTLSIICWGALFCYSVLGTLPCSWWYPFSRISFTLPRLCKTDESGKQFSFINPSTDIATTSPMKVSHKGFLLYIGIQ